MILVTGGTGLLGSNLLFQLCQTEQELCATYRDESKIERVKKLFLLREPQNGLAYFQKITWKKCDILDVVTLAEILQGIKQVYHCAALVSYRRRDFTTMMKVNGKGTANLVNLSLVAGVDRFCHVSSTAAVGKIKEGTIYKVSENNKWTQDKRTSGYAISKYTAEKQVWRAMEEGLDAVMINPSVIFGAGNWDESSLSIFKEVAKGLKFYTSGSNAFVDVRDVVTAMIQLTNDPKKTGRYLCTGTNSSFRELFQKIAQEVGTKAPQIRAGRLACELAWRFDSLKAVFTRKQTLTKESVSSAQAHVEYDSSKLTTALSLDFRSLGETIRYTVASKL